MPQIVPRIKKDPASPLLRAEGGEQWVHRRGGVRVCQQYGRLLTLHRMYESIFSIEHTIPRKMARVAVFIDWQNIYNCAREAFHQQDDPSRYGNVRPKAFAELLVRKGNQRDTLVHVGIYRGEPDPRKDPHTNAAHLRQRQAWKDQCGDQLLRVRSRALRYAPGRAASEAAEKGIDVQLAIDAMVMALQGEYDSAIIATVDTDLLPVLEGLLVLKAKNGAPDVAAIGWSGSSKQLRLEGVPVRWIGKLDYEQVRDNTDYNLRPGERRV